MKKHIFPVAALALLPLLSMPQLESSAAQASQRLTVIGQNDPAVDRQRLQAAINTIAPGGTVEVVGILQLDGERVSIARSQLLIRGKVVDNDHDGRMNEDWSDGVDNDSDGAVDEDDWDAVIRGVANLDGKPAEDPDSSRTFNRAFVLQGVSGTVRGITIRDLKFELNNRAITIQPEADSPGTLCETFVVTGGTAEDVMLKNNLFINNNRAIQILGAIDKAHITRNLFTSNPNTDIFVQGGLIGCVGSPGIVPLGTPRNLRVSHNVSAPTNIGMFIRLVEDASIDQNTITSAALGISVRQSQGVTVRRNRIVGAFRALVGTQPAVDTRFVQNTVEDSSDIGILIQNTATDYLVKENDIRGSATADIALDPTTSNNIVIARPDDEIVDQGTNNHLIIRN